MGYGFSIAIFYGVTFNEGEVDSELLEEYESSETPKWFYSGQFCDDQREIVGIEQFHLYGDDWEDVIKPMELPSQEQLDYLNKVLKKIGITQKPKWILATEF